MPWSALLNCYAGRGLNLSYPLSLSPIAGPEWPTQVADHHLVPNQVMRAFEFQGKERGGSFLFSKACKSLYRRRFKETEDAPPAAYMDTDSRAPTWNLSPSGTRLVLCH
jgi:hypothetical protein